MNEIIVRTNRSEYVGGSVIYGAAYLRIFTPVTADSVVLSFCGKACCKWQRTLPSVGPNGLDLQNAQMTNIKFEGEDIISTSEFTLVTFEDGTVPLGCYAYPFQLTLMQGLPNSFRRKTAIDEIKKASYEASVTYKITAKLHCNSSRSHCRLSASTLFSVRNEDLLLIEKGKCVKHCKAKVKSCFCFPKGELNLKVELDKVIYTVGETISVEFWIENKSDVKLEFAKIKLIRTIALTGRQAESEDDKLDIQEAFPDEIYNIKKELEMEGVKKKYFEVSLDLNSSDEEMLSSTLASIIKCRYQLEVEIVVPWDADISVFIPIEVFPAPVQSWLTWKPAEWIKNTSVLDANGTSKVSRHILESHEFANVPLPLKGLHV